MASAVQETPYPVVLVGTGLLISVFMAALGVAAVWPSRERRGMIARLIGAFGSIVLFVAIQAAAYLPVLKMCATVC